ncbi:hypothetical protein MJM95_28655, partial [Salmonella enterica subsp. enterica serovar Anatum]|nr:hypothetical protein [Salmonella enterica subsp. enterica serovar Anatum]
GDKAGKLVENLGAPVRPFFPQAQGQTAKVDACGIQTQLVQTASTPSLTRRLWLAFALMAALTLLSTVIGWISLRVISQVEQTNT